MNTTARPRLSKAALALGSTVVSVGLLLAAELMLRWLNPVPPDRVYEMFLEQSLKYLEPCAALQQLDAPRGGRPRIVVIGESSGEFLGSELDRLVRGGAAVQVANCAQGCSSFSTVVNRFDEAMRAKPDVIIIAFGHNYEFEEPLTAWQIRLQQLRVRSRLMGTVMGLVGLTTPQSPARVQRDLAPFEAFLRRAATETRAHGVRLVLTTMTSNYLYPPAEDAKSTAALYEARLLRMKDPGAGSRRLAEVVASSDDAGAAFELGVWLAEDGAPWGARAAFERALTLDPVHFRATGAQGDMIRRVAREEALPLRDTAGMRAANAPDGITGWETVSDNCHLHLDLFAEEAVAALAVAAPPTSPVPTVEAAADHLGGVLAYLSNWLDMAMRSESEWLIVAPIWRFLRIHEPMLEERFDAWLDDCAQKHPENAPRIRSMLLAASAQAHWLAGQKERARVLNERARAASDETSLPWVWKGLYDVADGHIDQARASFSKALQIEPGRADAAAYLERVTPAAGSPPG